MQLNRNTSQWINYSFIRCPDTNPMEKTFRLDKVFAVDLVTKKTLSTYENEMPRFSIKNLSIAKLSIIKQRRHREDVGSVAHKE